MKNLMFTLVCLISFYSFTTMAEDVPSAGTIVKQCTTPYGAVKITNNNKNGFDISFNGTTLEAQYGEYQIKDDLVQSEPTKGNLGEFLVYFAMLMSDIDLMIQNTPPPAPTPEEIEEMKEDPLFINAQLSFDLDAVKSVQAYEMIDPNAGSNPIGTFALAMAYDQNQKYLGSFISGLLVAECK